MPESKDRSTTNPLSYQRLREFFDWEIEIAARIRNEEWEFTGWRFDGRLSDLGFEISSREELGVGFVGDKVLTNDGTLCKFAFTRS